MLPVAGGDRPGRIETGCGTIWSTRAAAVPDLSDSPVAGTPYPGRVRLTEFWSRMEARFGAAYARSVAADYRLSALGATVDEALARGDEAKAVWRAVCAELDVPGHLR